MSKLILSKAELVGVISHASKKYPDCTEEFAQEYIDAMAHFIKYDRLKARKNKKHKAFKSNMIMRGRLPDFIDGALCWKSLLKNGNDNVGN